MSCFCWASDNYTILKQKSGKVMAVSNDSIDSISWTNSAVPAEWLRQRDTVVIRDTVKPAPVKYSYTYSGGRLDLNKRTFQYEKCFYEATVSASSHQGSACYNQYLFQFHNTHDVVSIYDMKTGSLVQNISFTPVSTYHCNNAAFGAKKAKITDPFPLLYVSMENIKEYKTLVYRITGTPGAYEMAHVQTITFPVPSASSVYYPNVFIDVDNQKFIVAGLSNYPWSKGTDNTVKYMLFKLPALSQGNVSLSVSDTVKTMSFPNMPTTQGGFVHGGKIYQVFGMSDNAQLNVIDIYSRQKETTVDFSNNSMAVEPEGCFQYDNQIYVNFIDGSIYRLRY